MIAISQHKIKLQYILSDALVAIVSWTLFFSLRKLNEGVETSELFAVLSLDRNFWLGLVLSPIYWFLVNSFGFYYRDICHNTYINNLLKTLKISFYGSLGLFFIVILDDYVESYKDYYVYIVCIFFSYFPISLLVRSLFVSRVLKKIKSKYWGYSTLLVGDPKNLENFRQNGEFFVGYVPLGAAAVCSGEAACKAAMSAAQAVETSIGRAGLTQSGGKAAALGSNQTTNGSDQNQAQLKKLGEIEDIENILKTYNIEEVLIFAQNEDEKYLPLLLSKCIAPKLKIRLKPNKDNILLWSIKPYNVSSEPMIELSFNTMIWWQKFIKRSFDLVSSSLAIILLSPLFAYSAYRVKKSSKGPIFYKQERLGLKAKPFFIYKFRSMYIDAEDKIPMLSQNGDSRVTPWGKIMRKYRIDEIPQFINILKGDMSLIGPRPERAYFVEQIEKIAPHYRLLFNLKPGLSSWGETEYGYASNVEEMVERLKYDIVYLENVSLKMDFKILLHTIGVVFRGEGK